MEFTWVLDWCHNYSLLMSGIFKKPVSVWGLRYKEKDVFRSLHLVASFGSTDE